jgi:hypothetical protein
VTRRRAVRVYRLYCGNLSCSTRTERQPDGTVGRLFDVLDNEIVDGETWLCPACRETS